MHLRHFITLLPALLLAACGSSQLPLQTLPQTALPAVDELDRLRSTSATPLAALVSEPLLEQLSSADGAGLVLSPGPSEMAFAVYRFEVSGATELVQLETETSGLLWLLVADFSSGRWRPLQELIGTTSSLTEFAGGGSELISPQEYAYAALVAPPDNDGRQATISSAVLTIEEPAPPGPTYYVAPPGDGGDDANPGSEFAPWATLQHAADSVVAGDTVIVRPGQYTGMMIQTSGTPGQPITFKTEGGVEIVEENENTPDGINIENWEEGPAIAYVTVEGFTVTGMGRTGIRAVGGDGNHAHHITIRGNTCTDNFTWGILTGHVDDLLIEDNVCSGSLEEHGTYVSNSGDRAVLRRNTCFGNTGCGMHFNGDASLGGDGILSDMLIEYNVCYDNGAPGEFGPGGGSAINCDGVEDTVIRGNLIYDAHASGISIYADDGTASSDNFIINNTVHMASDGRWCVNIQDGSTGCQVFNNILLSEHDFRGAIDIDQASLSGFSSDYNIVIDRFTTTGGDVLSLAEWLTETGHDAHSIISSPAEVFVDASTGNYRIEPAGPAHDKGIARPFNPEVDLALIARPLGVVIDIGAYEVQE